MNLIKELLSRVDQLIEFYHNIREYPYITEFIDSDRLKFINNELILLRMNILNLYGQLSEFNLYL